MARVYAAQGGRGKEEKRIAIEEKDLHNKIVNYTNMYNIYIYGIYDMRFILYTFLLRTFISFPKENWILIKYQKFMDLFRSY